MLPKRRLRTWLDRLGFGGLTLGLTAFGFVRGHYLVSVHLELAFVAFAVGFREAAISAVVFTAFISLSGLLYVGRLWRDSRFAENGAADGATVKGSGGVTAIVPVYRDAPALDRSVQSLLESAYDDLHVLVVTERDDRASVRKARDLAAHERVTCLVNDRYPGTKAGAINYAVEQVDTEYVGVFDADEVVHPSFVGAAVDRLGTCDVVQGRTVPETGGAVEWLAYCESVVLSYVGRRLLYLLTGFRMAASRAVVMDRSAVAAAGGYDTSMLTEDFDFAYRCYRAGLRVEEELRHPSRIEAAHSLRDWWGQRKRWMSGYAQVLHRLVGETTPPDSVRDCLSVAICASTVLGSLLCLSLVPKTLVLLVWGPRWLVAVSLLAVTSVTLSVRVVDRGLGVVPGVGWGWLLAPLVFPLYSLAAIKAVLEYVVGSTGEWYHVEKGEDATDRSTLLR